ncbi:MAG: hypothetical protein M1598_10130 [Actinobacteria bacterium]|nr:hypothetical protein [Actinomycetota bacterium]
MNEDEAGKGPSDVPLGATDIIAFIIAAFSLILPVVLGLFAVVGLIYLAFWLLFR